MFKILQISNSREQGMLKIQNTALQEKFHKCRQYIPDGVAIDQLKQIDRL